MRHVIFSDERGFLHRAMVRDTDGDEMARSGVPAGPPDLNGIDWEAVKKDINNKLVEQGLFTWEDINRSPMGLKVVEGVIRRYLKAVYQEDARLSKKR